jgi:hypothetical protein
MFEVIIFLSRLDIAVWLLVIDHFNGKTMLLKQIWISTNKLHLYTDAAGSLGFWAIFESVKASQPKRFYDPECKILYFIHATTNLRTNLIMCGSCDVCLFIIYTTAMLSD